jgi:hypothetical protein
MTVRKAEQVARLKRNEEKWSPALMESGWTVIPSIILEKQHALGLDAIDVNILMHLARFWWYSDNPPHPSKTRIAKCMNISLSTVRKRVKRMEDEGLIRRNARYSKDGGQQTNEYLFDGLIATVTPHAKEATAEQKKQRAETEERRNRKKAKSQGPTLVIDNTDGSAKGVVQ